MNLKLKKKNSLIILLLCSIMLVSCGQENAHANKLDISKEKNARNNRKFFVTNSESEEIKRNRCNIREMEIYEKNFISKSLFQKCSNTM